MAATDKPYRNQKTLDVVFGVSCVLLLVTTVLMLWLDHDLPWKANQRTFRDVVPAVREREMIGKLPSGEAVYEKRLALSRARERLDQGRKLVAAENRKLTAQREQQTSTVQGIKADYDSLMTYLNIDAEHWGLAKEGSHEKDRLGSEIESKKQRLAKLDEDLKSAQAKLDEINATYTKEVLKKKLPQLKETSDSSTASPVVSNGIATTEEDGPTLEELEKAQTSADDNLKKITKDFDRFAKAAVQTQWRFGDTFRALPILDAFESPTKIKQIWLPDLMIEYGSFRDVPRYDHCTTCHLGIDQPVFDRATLQALGNTPGHEEVDRQLHDLERKNQALDDLYRGSDAQTIIDSLSALEALLGPPAAQRAFPGLRMQVSYAKDLWERNRTERLNPLQFAEHLTTLVRTLTTAQNQVAMARSAAAGQDNKTDIVDKVEAKVSEAQAPVKARDYQVKAVIDALTAPALQPVAKLQRAGDMLKDRVKDGEKLGFDPNDLPTRRMGPSPTVAFWLVFSLGVVLAGAAGWLRKSVKLGVAVGLAGLLASVGSAAIVRRTQTTVYATRSVKLSESQVAMFAAHPRLDLFVDGNSPHSAEKFGCTICHAGQGSATDFQLASHMPNDMAQTEKWQKEHRWHSSHFWDFPMLQKRFVESSCVKCHHQMTDLIRHGNKEEAPKLLRGYNLVKDNGCFGCHEISGFKAGRSVGPDLRLEPAPALQFLSPAEEEKAKADKASPPGTMRKVGPALRRLAEKTNEEWTRRWIAEPRGFRPDTKMPHFYGLSTNSQAALKGTNQEKFPATEIHSIAHYLFAESKDHLKGRDTYRQALVGADKNSAGTNLKALHGHLLAGALSDRDYKELQDVTRRFGDLALLSAPEHHSAINDALQQLRLAQEQLQELHKKNSELQGKAPTDADKDEREWVAGTLSQARGALVSATEALKKAGQAQPIAKRLVNEDGREIPMPPAAKDQAASRARGRQLFTEKGCLACHAHEGITTRAAGVPPVVSNANHGPELSRIAAKIKPELSNVEARRWLVQWLLNPNVYHPRTRMPVVYLAPADAGDVAEWLLSFTAPELIAKTKEVEHEKARAESRLRELSAREKSLNEAEKKERKDLRDRVKAYRLDLDDLRHGLMPQRGHDRGTPAWTDLVQLARVYLIKAPGMTETRLNERFPADAKEGELKGFKAADVKKLPRDADERRLTGSIGADDLKWYIGRKAIGRLGCYGCHDIPGFETAKPIGTALNDWGKKDPERLAFEDAAIWVKDHFNIVDGRRTRRMVEGRIRTLLLRGAESFSPADQTKFSDLLSASDDPQRADFLGLKARAEAALTPSDRKELTELRTQLSLQPRIRELEAKGEKALGAHERAELAQLRKMKLWDDALGQKAPYESEFYHALEHRTREGFLFNKLVDPRSYDYNRFRLLWDDRLRMPQFRFARSRRHANESEEEYHVRQEAEEAEAREAVMTFILGLTAEAIPEKYVYKPSPDKAAEIKGRLVLEQFNCAGCHQVRPGTYELKRSDTMLDLLAKRYTETINSDTSKSDIPFPGHSAWTGSATTGDKLTLFGVPQKQDPEYTGPPVQPVRLTDALRFHGTDKVVRDLPAASTSDLPRSALSKEVPAYGGVLIDTLLPYLTAKNAKAVTDKYGTRFTDNETNARAALPPPLYREGERVQPDWLYRFLLNPEPIRPPGYMVLRMPRFNMSPEESRAMVNYFASVSKMTNPGAGVTYPYTTTKPNEDYWRRRSTEYAARLAKLKHLGPPPRLVELRKKEELTVKEKEELEKLTKTYADETTKFDGLQRKTVLSAEEKAELAAFLKRAKGSKLDARLRELRPVWRRMVKQEIDETQAALDAALKEVAAARKQKAPDLPAKEQIAKDFKQKLAELKKDEKKRAEELREHWRTREAYTEAAYKVVTSPLVCMSCHSVGKLKNPGEQGPNLELAAERLRPEWMEWWIAHPDRMFPYKPVMIQNFPNNPDPVKWTWQELFVGSPREQTTAARDVLLDLRRVSDFIDRRPAAPAAGGGK